MGKTFITSDEVAGLLGLTDGAAFLRRRERLEGDELFPLPMPHSQRPLLWKADEVRAWIDLRGLPMITPPPIDPALVASGKVSLLHLARV
jgi:predicted DNA-binding transcriptional regulator AlpA